MKKCVQASIVSLVILASQRLLTAQQVADPGGLTTGISAGTSVRKATETLARAAIPAGGPRPFAAHPNGDKWLFYTLRKGRADLVIQYSPGDERVTGVAIHYATIPRSRIEVVVPASSIRFHSDGSYSVRFPPATPNPNHATRPARIIDADTKTNEQSPRRR